MAAGRLARGGRRRGQETPGPACKTSSATSASRSASRAACGRDGPRRCGFCESARVLKLVTSSVLDSEADKAGCGDPGMEMTLRWEIVPSGLDAALTCGYCVSAERSGAFEGDLADEQAGVARAPARGRTGSRRDDHRRPGSPPPGTRQPDRAARAPPCRASARPRRPRNRCRPPPRPAARRGWPA